MTMTDEFSSGIRGRRKRVANRARPVLTGADVKPEAMNRVRTQDPKLDAEIHKMQRSIEMIQGTRGQQADHGVTFRDLDSELKKFTAEIENGYLNSGSALGDSTQALADAATAQATADQALADANEAHTGEVVSSAGSRVLTLHESAITAQPAVVTETVDGAADEVLIHDSSDTTLKRAVVNELIDGGYF